MKLARFLAEAKRKSRQGQHILKLRYLHSQCLNC